MKIFVTDALEIDLDSEKWGCRTCGGTLGSAREPYKFGMLVRERELAEIHAPIIDPKRYEFTYTPDPDYCRILEYCCPHCARLAEVEYLPPGHPPAEDIVFDIDALREQWSKREPLSAPALGPEFVMPEHNHKH